MIRTRVLPTTTYQPHFIWTNDTDDIKEVVPEPVLPAFCDGTHEVDLLMVPCFDEHGQLSHIDFYDKETVVYSHTFDCTQSHDGPREGVVLLSAGGKWCPIGDLSQMEQTFKCCRTGQVVTRSDCLSEPDTTFVFANKEAIGILTPQQAIENGAVIINGMRSFWCARKTKDSMFVHVKLRLS